MKVKYKGFLTVIAGLLGICIFIGVAYLFYDRVINNDTLVLVEDELSVNFINGNKINKDGTYTFSVTNNGANNIYFDLIINDLKNFEEKIRYNLISTEGEVHITNASFDTDQNILTSGIYIKAGETQNYVLKISNNTITSFSINVKKINESVEYFYATILKNNETKKNTETKVGEEIATTNEGLIEDIDDYGVTYYFRGKVDNNYVKFGNYLWRIVRVNGNGTVKLIMEDAISDLASYNDATESFDNLESTTITSFLQSFYDSYLSSLDSYIVNSKFCSENENTINGNSLVYNPYDRLITNKIPTFNCLGTTFSSKIGLLQADEIVFAGANFNGDNKEYYLYNEKIEDIWWTSTLATSNNSNFYPISVNQNGKLVTNISGTLYRNVRPTINLVRKVVVTGDGTINNPYEIV
ncbi:MAG: hypothetical protein NC483_01625 [Ruminococcus sp.]|nr:hypothetical protein [Ruminococcus sp.]